MVITPAGASACRPAALSSTRPAFRVGRAMAVAAAISAALVVAPQPAHAWAPALVEPRIDNLDELLGACNKHREAALERNRGIDAWVAYQAGLGQDVSAQTPRVQVPSCEASSIESRLGGRAPAVWAMTVAGGQLLYATVNLPQTALLVSDDGGHRWHYRHLFLNGFNADPSLMLRGMDYRDGLLAVASESGLLLSDDGGVSFTSALPDKSFWAVAISPMSRRCIVAGGNGTSFLTEDGGTTWHDLGFSRFTTLLNTHNPYLIDHITSVAFDPDDPSKVYFGTGSHLYRFVLVPTATPGRWQAMEGNGGGRVLDDSTVYNIEFGEHLMISTCNGVYYADHVGSDLSHDQADVSWKKFRDATFAHRGIGGPKGNLRAYYVTEDPYDPDRILVADFAGLYEGVAADGAMRWRRVEELPYGSPSHGYPEYTAIAWTSRGETVVGSRYGGIFVREPEQRPAGAGAPCVLR